jgi:hypothetical protein
MKTRVPPRHPIFPANISAPRKILPGALLEVVQESAGHQGPPEVVPCLDRPARGPPGATCLHLFEVRQSVDFAHVLFQVR